MMLENPEFGSRSSPSPPPLTPTLFRDLGLIPFVRSPPRKVHPLPTVEWTLGILGRTLAAVCRVACAQRGLSTAAAIRSRRGGGGSQAVGSECGSMRRNHRGARRPPTHRRRARGELRHVPTDEGRLLHLPAADDLVARPHGASPMRNSSRKCTPARARDAVSLSTDPPELDASGCSANDEMVSAPRSFLRRDIERETGTETERQRERSLPNARMDLDRSPRQALLLE